MTDIDVSDCEFLEAMQQAADIMLGKVRPARAWPAPTEVNVKAVRARMGLSQTAFARRFGFAPATVRDWEQGRRRPEAAARILMMIIARRPEVVDEVLATNVTAAA